MRAPTSLVVFTFGLTLLVAGGACGGSDDATSDGAAVVDAGGGNDAGGDGVHFADGPAYVPSQDACEDGRTIMPLPPVPMQSASCRDDRPLPGTPWLPAEGECMLPNCTYGTPAGAYGCVNPLDCSSPPDQCRPQGGSSACELGTCVYAACSGATEGQACDAGAGSRGICCAGQCTTGIDFRHDPSNCSACGVTCGTNATCQDASCTKACDACPDGNPGCNHCAAGLACTERGCAAASCATLADGKRCALGAQMGICCGHACVDPQANDAHCGACGIRCCAGTRCQPASGAFFSGRCV